MNYTWTYAQIPDVDNLVKLSVKYQYEVDPIFNIDLNVFAHNLVLGIVNQFYTGHSDIVVVARDVNQNILAYTWAKHDGVNIWSREPLINIRMAHVDPNLNIRHRILLLKDMLEIWERYAQITNTPIIASSSIRENQTAFMRLHEQAGYIVRGGSAYKRIDLSTKPKSLLN